MVIFALKDLDSIKKAHICIYPVPPHEQDTTQCLEWSLTGLNSEFFFTLTGRLTKVKKPNVTYYSSIAWGRILRCTPFPRVLALCKMQTTLSRIWTRIPVPIFYEGNYSATSTSKAYCCRINAKMMAFTLKKKSAYFRIVMLRVFHATIHLPRRSVL